MKYILKQKNYQIIRKNVWRVLSQFPYEILKGFLSKALQNGSEISGPISHGNVNKSISKSIGNLFGMSIGNT